MGTYRIEASWDSKAQVWFVENSDVEGLNAEADTADELFNLMKILIPDLLDLKANDEIEYELVLRRSERLKITAQA